MNVTASLPENIDALNAADTAKLFKDTPEGVDLHAVLEHERQRDEPRATVLKAAVAAELLTDEEADQVLADAAARRDQPTDSIARFPASRFASDLALLDDEYARHVIVGAFHSSDVEDDDELTQAEARDIVGQWLESPQQTDESKES